MHSRGAFFVGRSAAFFYKNAQKGGSFDEPHTFGPGCPLDHRGLAAGPRGCLLCSGMVRPDVRHRPLPHGRPDPGLPVPVCPLDAYPVLSAAAGPGRGRLHAGTQPGADHPAGPGAVSPARSAGPRPGRGGNLRRCVPELAAAALRGGRLLRHRPDRRGFCRVQERRAPCRCDGQHQLPGPRRHGRGPLCRGAGVCRAQGHRLQSRQCLGGRLL